MEGGRYSDCAFSSRLFPFSSHRHGMAPLCPLRVVPLTLFDAVLKGVICGVNSRRLPACRNSGTFVDANC